MMSLVLHQLSLTNSCSRKLKENNMRLLLVFLFTSLLHYHPALAVDTPFVAPVLKDHGTLLYTISVYMKTPLQPTKLQLHLGGMFTWVDCDNSYSSSTYSHIPCGTPRCDSFHSNACSNRFEAPGPACANDTCALFPENPVTGQSTICNALVDTLAFPATTSGSGRGQRGLISDFAFSCSTTSSLLKGLTKGVVGLVGLGRSNSSLLAQLSRTFSSPRYFALCLPASRSDPGVAVFGSSGPYYFTPGRIDHSKSLIYTPLILNPIGDTVISYYGQPSADYFIGLTSIKINGKVVPLNKSLLVIDENGVGGTKISTVNPYTVLETSIYKALVEVFVKESAGLNLTLAKPVKPFGVCFPASAVLSTRVGPLVPTIDLVLQSDKGIWRVFGSNSMVRIAKHGFNVWCLGVVDGGDNLGRPIVIGGHQIEDNLLQFDLESKRLGFSSSLLLHGTTCANFNFTRN